MLEDGVVNRFQPELRPARLLHAADREDDSLALWLEDLGAPATWTVEEIAEVARSLGTAQARLARGDLPAELPRGFLPAYLEPRIQHLAEPFASRRDEILTALDGATQTITHADLHPANIFPRDRELAVIDWAYCGVGPIGSDPGVLASDAIADELISPQEAESLVSAVWNAYRLGLGDDELSAEAEWIYAVGTALRYSWLPAWLAGTYGPEVAERRRPHVAAAHAAFSRRALAFL